MTNNIIKLLNASTNDLIYEWYPTSSNLIWHSDINKQLLYTKETFNGSYEDLLTVIHKEDLTSFISTKNNTNEDFVELNYKVIDKAGHIQEWLDKSILVIDDKEIKYIGICKNITTKKNYLINNPIFNNMIDSLDELIFFKDLDFRYIACNKAFCNFWDLPKDEIIGKTDSQLFDKEVSSFVNKYDKQTLIENKTVKSELWIKKANGTNAFIQTKKSIIKNENNDNYIIFGISRDQTKVHKDNLKLEQSKQTYMQLFQANKIPVLLINPKTGEIVDVNKAALNFYGYTFGEMKKLHISNINTLSKDEIKKEMALAIKEKRDHFLFKHKIKSGEIKDVEIYSGPIKFLDNDLIYSIVHDVSNKVEIEKGLRQAHIIYQNTKEGIFITNLKAQILSVNKAFTNITGYKEEEIVGLNPNFLKSSKHSANFYRDLWSTLKTKGQWEGEIVNKNKQGKDYPQWLSINTVYDYDNSPINYIAVFTDFSKIKKQEELLREKDTIMFQQSKMASMGEMLRNIAHQWRQPLSAITSSASGIKLKDEMKMLEEDELHEFCDGIVDSAKYLSDTIDDFSNFFRNKEKNEYFDLNDAVERAIELSSASLQNHDLTIFRTVEKIQIKGIKNEFVQVLLNLINNSKDELKKHSYKREIFINSKICEKNITLIFKDNAGGIPEDILKDIFKAYFTTKEQNEGTGIGLYMSKEIIENHLDGTIEVTNYDFNKDIQGAKFIIKIPHNIKK